MSVLGIYHAFANATVLNNQDKRLETRQFGYKHHARIRGQGEASDRRVKGASMVCNRRHV
jgi:hypothetical protein